MLNSTLIPMGCISAWKILGYFSNLSKYLVLSPCISNAVCYFEVIYISLDSNSSRWCLDSICVFMLRFVTNSFTMVWTKNCGLYPIVPSIVILSVVTFATSSTTIQRETRSKYYFNSCCWTDSYGVSYTYAD